MATLDTMLMPLNNCSDTFNRLNINANILAGIMIDASRTTHIFNDNLQDTGVNADTASDKLGNFLNTAELINGAVKGLKMADEFINTNSKLKLVNDGLQTQSELQDKIVQAANRSRGSYMDMASTVATLGSTAKDVFKTNDEAIAFSELIQKSMKVSGVSGAEQSTTMLQVAQTMGKGTLASDDFNSITDKVPTIMEALITATGKSEEELKGLASEGLMTADIIKNAMFVASNQINDDFNDTYVTFADIWNKIVNGALGAFEPLIEVLKNLFKNNAFQTILNGITEAMTWILSTVKGLIDIIVDNWPLILSVLLAIGTYLTVTLLPGLIKAGIVGLRSGLMTAVGWIAAHAPLVLLLGALALIIYALFNVGLTVEDIFNFVLGLISSLVNIFIELGNFILNVFKNPVSSVIYLFQGLGDAVLNILEKIAKAMDSIFGSDMADKVAGWRSGLKDWADKRVSKKASDEDYKKYLKTLDLTLDDFTWSNGDGENSKNNYGKLGKEWEKLSNSMTDIGNVGDFGTSGDPLTVKGIGRNDAVEVDMADEDLGYLRDIAERDYINKFSTATLAPQIQVQFGDVHQEADADEVAGRIKMILQEEIATAAEGAY